MTVEFANNPIEPSETLVQAIGIVAMPRFSNENHSLEQQDVNIDLPLAKTMEGAAARTYAIAATLIKERFQSLPANLKADERDARRDKIREDSIRTIFKTFKMIPNTDEVNEPFSRMYRHAETAINYVDKSRLSELYDNYEQHPAIVVIDKLAGDQSVTKIPRDDFVYMRRVCLLLIDKHTVQDS